MSGVRLKWGDELENGKGVVADAGPPPHDAFPDYNATDGQSCTYICNSGALLDHPVQRYPPMKQMPRASDRMLCHNMCRPIRVIRELDVELTFDGERESTEELFI
jgi:hypothetical protein